MFNPRHYTLFTSPRLHQLHYLLVKITTFGNTCTVSLMVSNNFKFLTCTTALLSNTNAKLFSHRYIRGLIMDNRTGRELNDSPCIICPLESSPIVYSDLVCIASLFQMLLPSSTHNFLRPERFVV